MNPGRELDLLVAEKVMKLKVSQVEGILGMTKYIVEDDNDDWTVGFLKDTLPRYSTNIEDAYKVIEKIRSLGFSISTHSYPEERQWLATPYEGAKASEWKLEKGTIYYQCQIDRYDPEYCGWVVDCDPCGESPAHAICLAALKTTESLNAP